MYLLGYTQEESQGSWGKVRKHTLWAHAMCPIALSHQDPLQSHILIPVDFSLPLLHPPSLLLSLPALWLNPVCGLTVILAVGDRLTGVISEGEGNRSASLYLTPSLLHQPLMKEGLTGDSRECYSFIFQKVAISLHEPFWVQGPLEIPSIKKTDAVENNLGFDCLFKMITLSLLLSNLSISPAHNYIQHLPGIPSYKLWSNNSDKRWSTLWIPLHATTK